MDNKNQISFPTTHTLLWLAFDITIPHAKFQCHTHRQRLCVWVEGGFGVSLLLKTKDYLNQDFVWNMTIKIRISVELWLLKSKVWPCLPSVRPSRIASLLNPPFIRQILAMDLNAILLLFKEYFSQFFYHITTNDKQWSPMIDTQNTECEFWYLKIEINISSYTVCSI